MRAGKCRLVYVRFAPPHGLARRVTAARRCWISAPRANTAAVIWRAFAISRSIPCGRIWRSLTPKSRSLSTARPGCAAILPAAFWRSTAFPARTCPAATAFTAPSPQSSWRRAPTPAAWALRSVKFVAKQGIYGILDISQLVLDPLSGSSIPVTEYKFFYGDRVIFTAFCADGWVIEVHDYRKQNDRAPQKPNSGKKRTSPGRMSAISCTRMISTIGIGTTLRISRKPRITITVTAVGDFGCCGKFYRDSTGGRLCMAAHTCILKPKEGCG